MLKSIHSLIIAAAAMSALAVGAFAEDVAPTTDSVPPAAATPAPTAPATTPPAATEAAPSTPVVPVATPVPAPKFEAPAINADTAIFRRTPIIDGIVEDGEWDAFYSFSATGWDATTFCDWDNGNLYVAVKSSRPVDILAVIDGNNDGWFHGEDNYEFRTAGGTSGNMTLSVSKYESRNSKSALAVPVSQEEASMIEIKSSRSESSHMIEMRIPALLLRGLRTAADRKLGFQISLNAGDSFSGWIPTRELGNTCECTLVTRKFAALKPLELGFDFRSDRVARGEELVGRLHLTNSGSETLGVKSYIVGGEGKAGDYLSSEKVRVEGLGPKKHATHDVESLIPSDMRLGCWAIGAEVRSGTERLGSALVSFEVVEPFSVELKLPSSQVKANVKDVSFAVAVHNNTRGRMGGIVSITLPNGWELWRNADKREFFVPEPGGMTSVVFKAKPPLGAPGDVPVKVDVTAAGKTLSAEGKLIIVNP